MIQALTMLILGTQTNQVSIPELFDQICSRPADDLFPLLRYNNFQFLGAEPAKYNENSPPDQKFKAELLMATLVQTGYKAIPFLLTKLKDKTPTAIDLGPGEFNVVIKYYWYDPMYRNGKFIGYPKVEEDDELFNKSHYKDYKVRVGDLAFFALGHITNRIHFRPRIYPGIDFMCSALDNEDIQKKVIKEWKNSSPDQLRKVLEEDVIHPDTYWRQVQGFVTYRTYFPETSAALALKCLRSSYGRSPIGRPNVSYSSLLSEFIPIANKEIDAEILKVIKRFTRDSAFEERLPRAIFHALDYLRTRPGMRDICLEIARNGKLFQSDYAEQYDKLIKELMSST